MSHRCRAEPTLSLPRAAARHHRWRRFAILAGSALLSLPAAAHDFWIEASDYRPPPGSDVSLTLRVGQRFRGESQPLLPEWLRDFSLYAGNERLAVSGFIGDDPAGRITLAATGTQVVGYFSQPSFVEIDPATFDRYLAEEGLEWVRDRRRARGKANAPAREYFIRCAKALLLPLGARPGDGFDRILGYPLELVPLADPYALQPGDTLPLRIDYLGQPAAGLLVIAMPATAPEAPTRRRSGRDGRVQLLLDRPGPWLVKAVHIRELPPPADADWESHWASLTFELPP